MEKETKEIKGFQWNYKIADKIRILEHEIQQHISNLNFSKEQLIKIETIIISKRGAVLEFKHLLKEKEKETKESK